MFRSSPRVVLPRVALSTSPAVSTALLCSRVLGSLPWLFLLHGFSGPFPGCFCFMGSRVPSLAVPLSSRPFGTCFNQPTSHTFGLKASVVHDHCKRRCCGHRTSNLLKTHPVSRIAIRYDVHSAFKHKLHLRHTACQTFRLKRLAKHSVSTACQAPRLRSDIHT